MSEVDPDHLLKSLEVEIALSKARHAKSSVNRNTIRIFSITILLLGLVTALLVMQYVVSQLPAHPAKPAASASQTPG